MQGVARRYRQSAFIIVLFLIIFGLYYLRTPSTVSELGRYAYQSMYHRYSPLSTEYHIMVVSDMDKASKISVGGKDAWKSTVKRGTLKREASGKYSVRWTAEEEVSSKLNEAGRGMELSDLCFFNGHYYTFDDRTGIIFQLRGKEAIPVNIMMDGNGEKTKGFKGEWCTVKDDKLYIGGMGKEWVNQHGVTEGYDPQWIKVLDTSLQLRHVNWVDVYESLRAITGTKYPGYLLHEAVGWHPIHQRWYFFPRRVSTEPYDADLDEYRGANIGITLNENFQDPRIISGIGPLDKVRGFSSMKFVPFREDEMVLLKTSEVDGVHSWITVITLDGRVLMEETKIEGEMKFEGIEFL